MNSSGGKRFVYHTVVAFLRFPSLLLPLPLSTLHTRRPSGLETADLLAIHEPQRLYILNTPKFPTSFLSSCFQLLLITPRQSPRTWRVSCGRIIPSSQLERWGAVKDEVRLRRKGRGEKERGSQRTSTTLYSRTLLRRRKGGRQNAQPRTPKLRLALPLNLLLQLLRLLRVAGDGLHDALKLIGTHDGGARGGPGEEEVGGVAVWKTRVNGLVAEKETAGKVNVRSSGHAIVASTVAAIDVLESAALTKATRDENKRTFRRR